MTSRMAYTLLNMTIPPLLGAILWEVLMAGDMGRRPIPNETERSATMGTGRLHKLKSMVDLFIRHPVTN